jgi:hypothetical protein
MVLFFMLTVCDTDSRAMLKLAIPLGSLLRFLLFTISKESIRPKTRVSAPTIRNLLTKVIGAVHGFLSSEKPDV